MQLDRKYLKLLNANFIIKELRMRSQIVGISEVFDQNGDRVL